MLRAAAAPLVHVHDAAMLDLDGVVYVGPHAVPGAAAAIASARALGMTIAYVTNNAAREPGVVAEHLTSLGVPAAALDVVTSSQAAAAMLRERFGAGARVFHAGGPGVVAALVERGLRPVGPDEEAVAVVTGYGPEVPWRRIMQAAMAVRSGLPWIATNTDSTIPTAEGIGPGHGALVRLISEFSGVSPDVAGKPARPLLDEAVRRLGALRPLMVGDRLDTDVEGAHNADVASMLVLTGVTGLEDLAAAPPPLRPSYIASDLRGLLVPHPQPLLQDDQIVLGGWRGGTDQGALVITGTGRADDWWRVAVTTAWRHLDATGRSVTLDQVLGSVPWCS